MFKNVINTPDSDKLYLSELKKDFEMLLLKHGDDEKVFQDFLEKNPCMVPNDNQIFGETGHGPYLLNLIAQPPLSGIFKRIPDFLWIAKDSMHLRPVFIEIEAPNKIIFKKNGAPTSDFTHSRNQLAEWQTILSRPENQLKFFNDLNLPKDLRDLIFKPSFILIYGRRREYENSIELSQKRSFLMGSNQKLMSYDRLDINGKALWGLTSEIRKGVYYAKYISPMHRVSDMFKDIYDIVHNLNPAIDNSVYITAKRKSLLKKRISEIQKQKSKVWDGEIKIFNVGDVKWE